MNEKGGGGGDESSSDSFDPKVEPEHGFRSVPRSANELVIEYQHGRHLPCMHSDLADPSIALRYFYEHQEKKLFRRFMRHYRKAVARLPALDSAAHRPDAAPGSPRSHPKMKALSLRRKDSAKIKPVEASAGLAPEEEQAAEQYKLKLVVVRAEIARILEQIEPTVDAFSESLFELAHIDAVHVRHEVSVMVKFAILDKSIGSHHLLKELGLCDSRNFRQIGECAVRAHIYALTALQGRTSDVAETRFLRVNEGAHIWLTKALRSRAARAMPIIWQLTDDTFEPLDQRALQTKQNERLISVVYLMVGILELMALARERDTLIKALLDEFV